MDYIFDDLYNGCEHDLLHPESGDLMSCGLWMICNVASVVCHGAFCGCGLGVLNSVISSCFYSSCAHPFVAIWSGLVQAMTAGAVMSAVLRL